MAGLDEFLIAACLTGRRPLSKLPWESSDGENTEIQEREGSPKHQQVEVVEEKAWNDWSSDTKQPPEEHSSYGLHGKSSVDDGSIVSKDFGDVIMAKVTLGELSMTEILYGHGYKAKSEPKQPVDEKTIVDLGFEDAFTRGNIDTSYSLQSKIYNTPSFLRETSSNSAQSTKNPSFLYSTEPGTSISSTPTRSAVKDNLSQIIDVGFTELSKTPKLNMPKILSSNEIVDVGLDPLGPSIFGMNSPPKSGTSIDSYNDAKLPAIISKQNTMPWDENERDAKQIKSSDFQIAGFQNGRLYSDSSCFDRATNSFAFEKPHVTLAQDLVCDEYKPFRPDINTRLENSIDFANPSTDVGYTPSFSNSDVSDRIKADSNIKSLSDSNYFGVKKTSQSISSSHTGIVPNLNSESCLSFNDLRNAGKKTTDPSVEPCYSKPPVVNTAMFRLSSPSYSNTHYDKRSHPNSAPMYSSNPTHITMPTHEVTRPDIVPAKQPSSMSVTMEMKDTNLTYDEYKPFRRDIKASLENSIDFANPITDVGYVPSFSDSDVSDRNKADTNIQSVSDGNYFGVKKTSQSISSSYTAKVPNLKSETSVSYNDLRNSYKKTTDPSVEPCYSKPPVVNTASFRLSSPSYSTTQYDKRSDPNCVTMYYSNPTHSTKPTHEVTRPDIVPAKQPSETPVTMEMKDTNLSYDEYKPFRRDIKASLENSIDFANPITDVGYVPSFSDSDVSDRNKADTNKQSVSDGNYFGVKKTSQSISSSYTGKVPNLNSETSVSYNDLRNSYKKTTDPSVEPCYSKPPVVNTASFRLSSPTYSTTQYDKRSDPNCVTMYYSNPTHSTKPTHEVTRPDIVPAKQPTATPVTMEMKDTNLSYDEYKPFRRDIKASLENSIDLANPITDVGYVPSFSDSYVSDRNKADTNVQSFSDSNYFGVKKTSQSISSSYTGQVPNLKSETSVSYNDLRNLDTKTTDPSVEPCYSKPPVVNTAMFRLSSPSYSNTQYDNRLDPNCETMHSSNPTHSTKPTHEVTRPDIVHAKQLNSTSVTMEMKDTNFSYDEYKPFRRDIKASLENSIDFANPITDVGYVPSFSDSYVSDRNKADTNVQSFSDSNYFGVKKTSQSISSSYTGQVPNLKSETSVSYNDLINLDKKTTDPSVEPCYSKPPVVNTAMFRLSSPMPSSNPTHSTKPTHEVTRPDIVHAKQLNSTPDPIVEPCYSKPPVVNTASFRLSSPSYSNTQYDKRLQPNCATMYSSNPTHITKPTHEVTIPDIVHAKQPNSMSVTMEMKDTNLSHVANAHSVSSGNVKRSPNPRDIDESKRVCEGSNQSRSSASVHKVSEERNTCNAFGKTISVKESVTSTSQMSNPPTVSNAITSWFVKSIESDDDVSEFETETSTNNIPVPTNKLNKDILITSDIETKQFGFESSDKDVKPSYANASAKYMKPKVFEANTIAVQPAGTKTCITIVKPQDARANTSDMNSLDLKTKVKTVEPASVSAKEYAPLRYEPKIQVLQQEKCQLNALNSKQTPNINRYNAIASTSKVKRGHKLALPKVSKVIVVEPEKVKRERRKKKIERSNDIIQTDIDDNMISNQNISDTEANTLPDDCKPVRTLMEDVRKQYVSDGDDDTYHMNKVASSQGFMEEDTRHIDKNIQKTYTQIMNGINSLGCKKESKKSSPKKAKCGTTHCTARKKVSFAKCDELPNTNAVNDLCKRCKKELSQSLSSHTTKNKSAVKTTNTDKKELEVNRQQLESHRNGPVPSDVYYQLIDIVERKFGAEQRRSLMRSTSIADILDMMHCRSNNVEHGINDMADHEHHEMTEEHIDSLIDKNELKTENGTRCNSLEGINVANGTVSGQTGLSEQIDNNDVTYRHDTENDKANKDCRKTSKGRKFIDFMKSLFCCKRKNKAFDVDN